MDWLTCLCLGVIALAHRDRCNQHQMAPPDKTKYTACALCSTPINSTGLFCLLFQQLWREGQAASFRESQAVFPPVKGIFWLV